MYNGLFENHIEADNAIYLSKELFAENDPYFEEQRLDRKVVIFNDHFIKCAVDAMTTNCMAKMSDIEEELFFQFASFEDGFGFVDITEEGDKVLEALDKWFFNMVTDTPNPYINECWK